MLRVKESTFGFFCLFFLATTLSNTLVGRGKVPKQQTVTPWTSRLCVLEMQVLKTAEMRSWRAGSQATQIDHNSKPGDHTTPHHTTQDLDEKGKPGISLWHRRGVRDPTSLRAQSRHTVMQGKSPSTQVPHPPVIAVRSTYSRRAVPRSWVDRCTCGSISRPLGCSHTSRCYDTGLSCTG